MVRSWILIILIILGLGFISFSPVWSVKKITCRLDESTSCPDSIVNWLAAYYGKRTLYLNTLRLKHSLLHEFSFIDGCDLSVNLPDTVSLTLKSAPPFARLVSPRYPQGIVVTREGFKTPITETIALPILEIEYDIPWLEDTTTTVIPGEIRHALRFINLLQKSNVTYVKVELTDTDTITLDLKNGLRVLFSPSGDEETQLATLQSILSTSTINPEVKIIDVRFNKPVLKSIESENVTMSSDSGTLEE